MLFRSIKAKLLELPSSEVSSTPLDATSEANRNIKMKRNPQVMNFLEPSFWYMDASLGHGIIYRLYKYIVQRSLAFLLVLKKGKKKKRNLPPTFLLILFQSYFYFVRLGKIMLVHNKKSQQFHNISKLVRQFIHRPITIFNLHFLTC